MEHCQKFLGLWKYADPSIPEVEDAKKRWLGEVSSIKQRFFPDGKEINDKREREKRQRKKRKSDKKKRKKREREKKDFWFSLEFR